MAPLRVLFWYRRRPAERGGDWIALQHYTRALRAYEIVPEISVDPAQDLAPYDVVHLFNLCDPYSALEYALQALRAGKPIATTPTAWTHAQWLEARATATPETHPEFFLDHPSPAEQQHTRYLRELNEELWQRVQRLVLDAADIVFTLSQMETDLLGRDYATPREKCFVTYNGIDPSYGNGDAARFARDFGTPAFTAREFVYSVGRLEEKKNTIGLIRAWRNERIPLVLIGRTLDERYAKLCRAEASSNIVFLGATTSQQVADAGSAARVHVLASWWEEMGLVAHEAGLAGCNLVMTQNGPGREYFGEYCFTCDPAAPDSIRDAIRRALAAPRATGLPARLRERFTWDQAAQVTRTAYDQMLPGAAAHAFDPQALGEIVTRLAELAHWKEEDYARLEAQTVRQADWAHELQEIVAARDRERARLLSLPLVGQVLRRTRRT